MKGADQGLAFMPQYANARLEYLDAENEIP